MFLVPMLLRRRRSRSAPPSAQSDGQAADERLRALIADHAPACYRVALSIVRDPSLAEDVVQESMIKAWRGIDGFRGESSERSWLLRITHNTAVSTLRRLRDEATDPFEMPDRATFGADVQAEGRRDLEHLAVALDALDELTRSILVLRDAERLPYQQIAETLGVSVPLVKTRLLRARRELQRAVESGAMR